MRSIFAPPEVEPAHDPKNMIMHSTITTNCPQASKSVTTKPVVEMADAHVNRASTTICPTPRLSVSIIMIYVNVLLTF